RRVLPAGDQRRGARRGLRRPDPPRPWTRACPRHVDRGGQPAQGGGDERRADSRAPPRARSALLERGGAGRPALALSPRRIAHIVPRHRRSAPVSAARRHLVLSILALACAASTLVLAPPAGARRGSTAARAHRHTVRHARRHARKRAKHHREVAEPSPPLTGPVGEVPPVEEAGPPGGTGAPPAGEAPASEEGPAGGEAPAGEEGPGAEEAKRSPADPFAATGLYVEPGSPASQTAAEWAREGRSAEAAQIEKIATRPVAKWFGDWTYGHGGAGGDVSWWVGQAAAARRLPLLVAYDLPWRDCSQYSSGGAADAAAYKKFIDEMAAGIAGRSAAVILEPDALSELECLGSEQQSSY